jgi:hypothetical protein
MNTRKLERETGVDRSAWRKLEAEGVAVTRKTKKAVLARRERLDEERIAKMKLQREILETELAQRRGELISRARVEQDALSAGSMLSAHAYAMAATLPGQLVGLPENEIFVRLQSAIDRFIEDARAALAVCAAADTGD